MTDGRTDRRTGKNNMSPDPVGGRHDEARYNEVEVYIILFKYTNYCYHHKINVYHYHSQSF